MIQYTCVLSINHIISMAVIILIHLKQQRVKNVGINYLIKNYNP